MREFFTTLRSTVYNPTWYKAVALEPASTAFRFYARATLALAVIMTIVFSIVLIPQGVRFIKQEAPALVKKYFPEELVVTIKKGEASSNVTEPYVIPADADFKNLFQGTSTENLFVVDTKSTFNKQNFTDFKTFALLTKGELVTQSDRGRITIQDLSGTPDMVVSQASLLDWVDSVSGSLGAFVPAGIFVTFVIIGVGFALYLLPVLLFALIPFFFAWVKKMPLSYASAYKMSLYAVLPGLFVKSLLNMGGVFFVPPYLTFLIFVLIIFINMKEEKQPTLFTAE